MKNGNKDDSIEEIKDLRIKSGTEANLPEFKKSMFGGYDPAEVNEYLENIRTQQNNTIEAYQERFDEFTSFIEMLQKEKGDLSANIASLQQQLAKTQESKGSADSNLASLNEERGKLLQDLENQSAKYGVLEKELADLRASIASGEESRKALQAELAAAKEESGRLNTGLEAVSGKNKSLSDEIAALKAKIRKYEEDEQFASTIRDKIDLNHENELLREEIRALSESRDSIAIDNATLKSQIDSLNETIARLRNDNQDLLFRNNSLLSQIRQTDMNVGMKTGEFVQKQLFSLDKSTGTLSGIIADLNELKEEAAGLRKFINDSMVSKTDIK